jgi:hypothetical protein
MICRFLRALAAVLTSPAYPKPAHSWHRGYTPSRGAGFDEDLRRRANSRYGDA